MKKRIISFLVLLSLIISLVPTQIMASTSVDTSTNDVETTTTETETEQTTEEEAESTTHPDWEYELYGDGVALTKYLGTSTDIYIPNKLEIGETEYTVLKLADSILENNDAINSVTLASGILEIGNKAFYDCDNLVCILLSEELTTIGNEAFYSCDAFNSVILYDNITSIGTNAFAECPSLTIWCNENTVGYNYAVANSITYEILNPDATPETIELNGINYYILNGEAIAIGVTDLTITEAVIPSTVNGYPVTELRETFRNCSSLTSVILPNSLTTIGTEAFYYCSKLTSITIPDSITNIGNYAFCYCTSLTSVTIPNSVTSVGTGVFWYCSSITSVTISNSLTYISKDMFRGCKSIIDVLIPDSVTKIGSSAFSSCDSLTNITIPNSVTYIDSNAFWGCISFTSITIPDSVKNIGVRAFGYCSNLTSVTIPYSLKVISSEVFDSCKKLTSVTIADGVTRVESDAFLDCKSLKSVIVPNSVTYISTTAFPTSTVLLVYEDSYAHTFAVDNELMYHIYNGANEPEIYDVDGIRYFIQNGEAIAIGVTDTSITEAVIHSTVEGYPVTELRETFKYCYSLTSVTLPTGLKAIGESAFNYCSKLTSITIPSSVTSIGDRAFYYCQSLISVTIPDSVTKIGDNAFYYCQSLISVTIPDSVTNIGDNAFYYCTKLTSVTIPDSVTKIGSSAFLDCRSLQTVIIPSSTITMSTDSFPTGTILMVEENSYAHIFAIENELLYYIYDGTNMPEIYEVDNIRYFIQDGEALAIGVTDTSITEAVIRSIIEGYPVTELRGTFRNCSSLTSVIIPNSIICIGDNAFSSCRSLTSITIPDSVTSIGTDAFSLCTSLTNVTIPDSVKIIGRKAFWCCQSLISVTIPNSVTSIGDRAFYSCTSLTSVTIPNSIISIGDRAFQSCTSLTSVTIPNSVTSIGDSAFQSCTSLTNVTMPDSVTYINSYVFYDCSSLKMVIVPSSVTKIYTTSFATNTILLVEENSYAHTFAVDNNLLYFVVHKTENPEIAYGSAIEGVVTNSDGTVASGVTVEIYYEDGTLKESVTTDENGSYAFTYAEVGKYTIKAYNSLGNTASTTVYVKRMNVFNVFLTGDTSITLKTSYTVSGTASENVTVKLTDLNGNVIATAEANTTFNFKNVANGTYLVVAETENGSASQEITVFNSNVTDINLEINTNTANIWGYVEVEDRKYNKHRRNWVEVSVYNEEGNVIATQKSDKDGKYEFANLPFGDYSIVAKVSEMRPDKKHGYDRSHDLYGYAYISITESGTYEVETIVLYEDNDHTTTVSGKANINKDKSKSCEFIMYNAFGVEYAKIDSENGRYTFKNVKDGLYIITALTENDGMGYTVITIRNGKVHGNTNINIVKADRIKDREDKFENDIPDFENEKDIESYRSRIADEKRFYDSLSAKEKKQLSKKYISRLNKYIEWLANCDYASGDGTKVENGGLVVSGDELENGDDISFTITVEKQEMWKDNENGVETSKDFIHHNMKDKAGDREIVQYYEISMTKTSNGKDKVITSVYKDTDAMGKFRITLEIPEEYRGHKHYSLVHVHCGEVVTLTDLDNNPDTITIEVDKFSTFALTTTDEELVDESVSTVTIDDIIKFKGYSIGPDGTSMCVGFDIDHEALEAYELKTGKTVDFGAVFTSFDLLGNNTPLNSITGEANELDEAYVLKTSLKDYSYTTYDFVLTDITEDIAEHNFVIAGYIYDGESVSYIQSETMSSTVIGHSLNGIKEQAQ